MKIQEHIPLKELTTMKIGGTARYFVVVTSVDELKEALLFAREKDVPCTVLGGGSNVLIADGELNRLVIKMELKGIEYNKHGTDTERSQHGSNTELVVAGAGESWDGLVAQAVGKGLWGIENLSGIPGTVGATPVQNIGAYGAELADVLAWVECLDIRQGSTLPSVRLNLTDCEFGYRDSIFKHPKGKGYIVTRVAFRLRKNGIPNLEYKDLKNYFAVSYSSFIKGGGESPSRRISNEQNPSVHQNEPLPFTKEELPTPTLPAIRQAVLEIRGKKFPDLNVYGTAGSFFKNPIIPKEQFDELKKKYPDLPGFPIESNVRSQLSHVLVKTPLAWILDNVCNIKGKTEGRVGLFRNQPIVLVNFGGASAEEVSTFARQIVDCVKEKTGIDIEWEVQKIK